MKKVINPETKTVHMVGHDQEKYTGHLLLTCMCGKETGPVWLDVLNDTEVNCLICRSYAMAVDWDQVMDGADRKNVLDDWNIIVDKDECEFMLPSNNEGHNDCNYGEDVVPCVWGNCSIKSSLL